MVWIQTVCKGYQQRSKVAASKERVKGNLKFATDDIFKFCCYIKANIKDNVLKRVPTEIQKHNSIIFP